MNGSCQVCRKACKAKKCAKCGKAFYCSVSCQKVDWKARHRYTCQANNKDKADWALQQLAVLAHSLDVEEAKEHQDKAKDEIERRRLDDDKSKDTAKLPTTPTAPSRKVPNNTATPRPTILQPETRVCSNSRANFSILIEEMIYVSQFQMTLKRKRKSLIQGADLSRAKLLFRDAGGKSRSNETTVVIFIDELASSTHTETDKSIFSATLPRCVNDTTSNARIRLLGEDTLQIAFNYQPDPTRRELSSQGDRMISLEKINQIQCSSCCTALLGKDCRIVRNSELPLGHWDEISDYLICYSGQPSVDFTMASAAAERSAALQDANVLCLNYMDVETTASVQPVPGYGDAEESSNTGNAKPPTSSMDSIVDPVATVRGERNWREVTGGATVCCNHCSAPIGFASMEAPECFRLLKHRLSVPSAERRRSERLSSCASFVVREMVRYAEAKAIFTFIVTLKAPHMTFASTVHTKCILLRLVSWDCNMAISSFNDEAGVQEDHDDDTFCFRRYAKLVFEETYDRKAKRAGNWIWGGVDLCCPPLVDDTKDENAEIDEMEAKQDDRKVSAARIQLSQEDYNETLEILRKGQNIFTRDVVDATILVKMGSQPKPTNSAIGLTVIALNG